MKKVLNYNITKLSMLLMVLTLAATSCKKDGDGSPGIKAGEPQSAGIDPGEAGGGAVVTLNGSGLGDMRSIVFDKGNVPAQFYSTLNTESALVFRVPDTSFGGPQNIVFTNSAGKSLTVPFNVIAIPSVTGVSNYNFTTGSQITLTGNNLDDVNKVILTGTSDEATIISQTRKELTIQMPSTALIRGKLDITNLSGTITTGQEFVSITNSFIIFAEDWGANAAYGGSVQSWSFDCAAYGSPNQAKSGTSSLRADYTKGGGGLSLFLGCNWDAANCLTFTNFYTPTFLTFWAKGDGTDANITIVPDNPWPGANMWGGPAATGSKTFSVIKDVWTYFRIPSDFITGGFSRLNFKIEGTGDITKTIYFDDVLFVK